ncbi:MAG: MFS transporter [Firmicutes bacterium]|nr:MFS transporter [Bacillota bacterium]
MKLYVPEESKHSLHMAALSGIYWFVAAIGCYQTLYLQSIGFTASNMGVLNAICSGIGIAAMSFWGIFSDSRNSVRLTEVLLLAGCMIFFSMMPFVKNVFGNALWPYFILCPICTLFRNPVATFHENLIVRNCNELRLNYGRIRSIGSILFAVSATFLVVLMPVESTFWVYGLGLIPVIVLTLLSRDPKGASMKRKGHSKDALGQLFKNHTYVLFLVFSFLFYVGANFEGAFIPYYMQEVGIDTSKYSLLLAYRAVFEVPFLLLMVKLRTRFPLRKLILVSPILMGIECLGFAFFVKSWPMMLIFASFFGLGNGMFIGTSLNYVYEIAPDDAKASAQAFFASTSQIAAILGNLVGGFVLDAVGGRRFYLVAALLYLTSILMFILSGREHRTAANAVSAIRTSKMKKIALLK